MRVVAKMVSPAKLREIQERWTPGLGKPRDVGHAVQDICELLGHSAGLLHIIEDLQHQRDAANTEILDLELEAAEKD